jgi:hypothetical protein
LIRSLPRAFPGNGACSREGACGREAIASLTTAAGATTDTCRRSPRIHSVTGRGAVFASRMLRVWMGMRVARWIVSTGMAVFRTMPPETPNRVTGVVCWKIVALCCGETRTEATFVPTKRFMGTKTYCVDLMTTGRP